MLAAQLCRKHNVPFVTIDEKPDHEVCRLASIIAVSGGEYLRGNMPEYDSDEGKARLIQKYAQNTDALVIITGGGGTTFYGRKGEVKKQEAFRVDTVSTLGAGDTFKAGCVYGLLKGYNDDETVRFASACAAVACTKFPLHLNPPTVEETERMMITHGKA